jgi:hypothetical protein
MVNANRVKRKLPSLLVDGDTSKRKFQNEFMRNRYRLQQFQKRKPERFKSLMNRLCGGLEEIDRELKSNVKGARAKRSLKPCTMEMEGTWLLRVKRSSFRGLMTVGNSFNPIT